MALVTLPEAKTHLNISSSTTDDELQDFIDVACALVQGYADRTWDSTTITETYDGGGSVFLLRQTPVSSVTSITVTVPPATSTVLTTAQYEVNESAGIIRTTTDTTAGTGNVAIVYAVGATVPPLARHAALETVRHLWQTQRGNVVRNPMNGEDYMPGTSFSLPRRVMELLDPIRNVN